jgi:hypothetical protein
MHLKYDRHQLLHTMNWRMVRTAHVPANQNQVLEQRANKRQDEWDEQQRDHGCPRNHRLVPQEEVLDPL